jgi:hypothetical protein
LVSTQLHGELPAAKWGAIIAPVLILSETEAKTVNIMESGRITGDFDRIPVLVYGPEYIVELDHSGPIALVAGEINNITPISKRSTGEIVGIIAKIRGLKFVLLAADHPIAGTNIDKTIYRPGRIVFENWATVSTIELSWEDRLAHDDCFCTLGNRDSAIGQFVPVV